MKKNYLFAAALSLLFAITSPVLAGIQDDLCTAAQDYYEAHSESGYRPPEASCSDNGNGTYTIHLYEIVNDGNEYAHMSTSAWYEVDKTGAGKDIILGNAVQLMLPGSNGSSYSNNTPSYSNTTSSPFYGIWCEADKDYNEAQKYMQSWRNKGFSSADLFLTTDWSNLNSEPWYVVSVGKYGSEGDARNALSKVQAIYADAYVKYSGEYLNHSNGTAYVPETAPSRNPFYGIWCEADRDYNEAEKSAQLWRSVGFPSAQVFLTSDWDNLNSDPWYAVSAGVYDSWNAAEAVLFQVQEKYPDAYIKYSGSYKSGAK